MPKQRLKVELDRARTELDQVKNERDLLQIQCINQSKTWKRDPKSIQNTTGLTTRELIQNDKKEWHLKAGQISGFTTEELQSLLKDVCVRLGITDYENLGPCIDKIQTVVGLIPQMEKVSSND